MCGGIWLVHYTLAYAFSWKKKKKHLYSLGKRWKFHFELFAVYGRWNFGTFWHWHSVFTHWAVVSFFTLWRNQVVLLDLRIKCNSGTRVPGKTLQIMFDKYQNERDNLLNISNPHAHTELSSQSYFLIYCLLSAFDPLWS